MVNKTIKNKLEEKTSPKISIIVPVYNVEKYLQRCLDSLVNQTLKDIEIICINDGSKDNSYKILKDYAKRDKRIKVFTQDNSGPAKARNVGLKNATGEFIMFCDSDDEYTEDMCKDMLSCIKKQNVDLVMCNTTLLNREEKEITSKYYFPFSPGKYTVDDRIKIGINVYLWNKIFKKSIIDSYNIKFPEGHKSDDNLFIYEYVMVSDNIYILDEKLYYHYDIENSIMDLYNSKKIKLCDVLDKLDILINLYNFLQKYNIFVQNKKSFSYIFYTELFYAWIHVPEEFKKEFLTRSSEVVQNIKINNFLYNPSDLYKLKVIEVINNNNYLAAEKLLDFLLSTQNKARNKYLFAETVKPIFKEYCIPIVFNCDNNFVMYLSIALQSIIDNSSVEHNYDICILNEDISERNQEKLHRIFYKHKNFSLRFFNMKNISLQYNLSKYKTINHVKTAAYYRLFVPEIFKYYKKVVYLDSDIIVNCDIYKLIEKNIENYSCAAVRDFYISNIKEGNEFVFPGIIEYSKNILNISNFNKYFNSGVMIFNINKMNKFNYFDKFIKIAEINNKYFNDQNVLNSVLQDDVYLLDSSYNMQLNSGAILFIYCNLIPLNKIKILHFCSKYKPWNKSSLDQYDTIWWEYARKTPFYEEILMNLMNAKSTQNVKTQRPNNNNYPQFQYHHKLERIFSVKGLYTPNKKYKVLTIFGIKIKF
ncbi:glycosyltransferase [bacterium]|nr:glycosyltransferase [bacterium]